MKSYEKHLSEKCPAVIEWHKIMWEKQNLSENAEVIPAKGNCAFTEETFKPELIKEWKTIHGKRRIDNNFTKNMIVGY